LVKIRSKVWLQFLKLINKNSSSLNFNVSMFSFFQNKVNGLFEFELVKVFKKLLKYENRLILVNKKLQKFHAKIFSSTDNSWKFYKTSSTVWHAFMDIWMYHQPSGNIEKFFLTFVPHFLIKKSRQNDENISERKKY